MVWKMVDELSITKLREAFSREQLADGVHVGPVDVPLITAFMGLLPSPSLKVACDHKLAEVGPPFYGAHSHCWSDAE